MLANAVDNRVHDHSVTQMVPSARFKKLPSASRRIIPAKILARIVRLIRVVQVLGHVGETCISERRSARTIGPPMHPSAKPVGSVGTVSTYIRRTSN